MTDYTLAHALAEILAAIEGRDYESLTTHGWSQWFAWGTELV